MRVHDGGMAKPKHSGHDGPEKPPGPTDKSQEDQDRHKDERHCPLVATPQRIGDMTAIELTNWQEVERRDEEAEPGGEADRVQHNVRLRRDRPYHKPC